MPLAHGHARSRPHLTLAEDYRFPSDQFGLPMLHRNHSPSVKVP
ncbi:hypothetical protein ACVWXL_008885 [Bradyrhizobium sp. GM22.5]